MLAPREPLRSELDLELVLDDTFRRRGNVGARLLCRRVAERSSRSEVEEPDQASRDSKDRRDDTKHAQDEIEHELVLSLSGGTAHVSSWG